MKRIGNKLFLTLLTFVLSFFAVVSMVKPVIAAEASEVVNPLAHYEFKDAANPGKDTMGNYDLALAANDGGSVAVSNGVATFNGTAALVAPDNDSDISEDLESFTLAFDIAMDGNAAGNWSEPIGFGWNAWECTKWNVFSFSSGSTLLRYSTASKLVEGVGDVDNNGNQWWAPEIKNLDTNFTTIILSVDLKGNITVYADGVAKYSYATPEDYNLRDNNMYFAIGGNYTWKSLRNMFHGQIADVKIYDFAFNHLQVAAYGLNNEITSKDIAEQETLNPLAHYNFADAENPGKDAMGNYDLDIKLADGQTEGTINVSNGVATFNGTAGLLATNNDNDISEHLGSFTLAFDVKDGDSASWSTPAGFGFKGWDVAKRMTFSIEGGTSNLRFSSALAAVDKVSEIDGTDSKEWGKDIGVLSTEGFDRVILRVDLNGKINVYLNGVLKYSYDTPAGFTLKDTDMRFAIGGESCWGNIYMPFVGEIKNVRIYDFALDDLQVAQYNLTSQVCRALDATVEESITDLSTSVIAPLNATAAEILLYAPASSYVDVKMSSGSVAKSTVHWSAVEEIEGETYLVGDILDLVNKNNVKAYAKITLVENTKTILPVALYEFKDAANPGKDSMGNYNLVVRAAEEDVPANIVVENGVATFDGTGSLISGDEANDISEKLGSFTLSFTIKQNTQASSWSEPIGFGWDNWTPENKWFTFQLKDNDDLRFTLSSDRDDETGKSDVDNNGNQWWGPVIGNIATEKHVSVSVELGGKVIVYVDGVAVKEYVTPETFSMQNSVMQFSIGASASWGGFNNPFYGQISNVSIYDFALNAQQVALVQNGYAVSSHTVENYIESIDSTPVFAGDVANVELSSSMSNADILAALNPAKVVATLADGSTKDLAVEWTSVVLEEGVYKAIGYAKASETGALTTLAGVEVELVLPIHVHTLVELPAVAPTCTETGLTAGQKCSDCEEIVVAQEEVAALGHDYEVVYTWAEDYSSCTAIATCAHDAAHVVTETVNSTNVKVDATVDAEGSITYTATFAGAEFAEQTHVETIAKLPATQEPENPDNSNPLAGCFGSVVSSLFGMVALCGAVLVLRKNKKDE